MNKEATATNDNPTFKGKKNIYVCDTCKGHVVTMDRDHGVTPFMIECKATAFCNGMMKSSMYRVFDQDMRAGYEWYKPTAPVAVHLQHHVDQGGLLLRKITLSEPEWPPQASAVGLAEGTMRHGSTGQLFEVKNGRWERASGGRPVPPHGSGP